MQFERRGAMTFEILPWFGFPVYGSLTKLEKLSHIDYEYCFIATIAASTESQHVCRRSVENLFASRAYVRTSDSWPTVDQHYS